jgi:hypothetical protein
VPLHLSHPSDTPSPSASGSAGFFATTHSSEVLDDVGVRVAVAVDVDVAVAEVDGEQSL